MGGVFRGSLSSTLENGKTQLNTHLQSYTAARRCNWSITTARSGYGKSNGGVKTYCGDYQDVEILPNSVIYCDIPYYGTNVYDKEKPFDYDRFYTWALKQTQPLFISEYWMPEEFICVKEIEHNSSLSATANNKVTERVFVPKHQHETFKENQPEQLTLF